MRTPGAIQKHTQGAKSINYISALFGVFVENETYEHAYIYKGCQVS
jgi:hypothetical protein